MSLPAGVSAQWWKKNTKQTEQRNKQKTAKQKNWRSIFDIFRHKKQTKRHIRNAPKKHSSPSQRKKKKVPNFVSPALIPKLDNARIVAVIGDEFATRMAWGLKTAFHQTPAIEIKDFSRKESGITKLQDEDWQNLLANILKQDRLIAIVVMTGIHDRTTINLNKKYIKPRTDEWNNLYRQRVEALALTLQATGRYVYWVGLPPVRDAHIGNNFAFFNDIFKEKARLAGIQYIDIWTAFLNEKGEYTSYGPDLDGQKKRLRISNGFGFTKTGQRKLAHFVEKAIRHDILGNLSIANLNDNNLTTGPINEGGGPNGIGPIVSLHRPITNPTISLIRSPDEIKSKAESPLYRYIIKGEPMQAHIGRADDTSWPLLNALPPVKKSKKDTRAIPGKV